MSSELSRRGHTEIHFVGDRTSRPLDDMGGRPNTAPHRNIQRPVLNVLGQKSANKSIASPVGIHNVIGGQLLGGELEDLSVLDTDDGVGSLGDDDEPAPGPVLLGQHSDPLRDLTHVAGLQAVHLGVGGRLSLVSEDYVGEGHDGHHLVLEELDEEGGRQV